MKRYVVKVSDPRDKHSVNFMFLGKGNQFFTPFEPIPISATYDYGSALTICRKRTKRVEAFPYCTGKTIDFFRSLKFSPFALEVLENV